MKKAEPLSQCLRYSPRTQEIHIQVLSLPDPAQGHEPGSPTSQEHAGTTRLLAILQVPVSYFDQKFNHDGGIGILKIQLLKRS